MNKEDKVDFVLWNVLKFSLPNTCKYMCALTFCFNWASQGTIYVFEFLIIPTTRQLNNCVIAKIIPFACFKTTEGFNKITYTGRITERKPIKSWRGKINRTAALLSFSLLKLYPV